ncbi:MAG: serine hydrolase domain-containing protein [Vicinamibacterales bacterium]
MTALLRILIVVCVGSWLLCEERLLAGQVAATRLPALDQAVTSAAEMPRLRSLLVNWKGQLVLERYFRGTRATHAANIKSASKSVLSALVGLAIDRQLLNGVRHPIGAFFSDDVLGADAERKRRITVEDLLTMRSGLEPTSNRNYGAWVTSRNWVRYVLSRSLVTVPGTSMAYSTGNTHLLSAILTKASGRSTWQFAQDVLARPLGFSLAPWPKDPQGIFFGGNDMLMTPRQMIAFGELYRNRGRIGDRQVVSASWIDASIQPRTRSEISDQQYGYGWWIRDFAGFQSYFAWGYGGQFVFVVPDLQLVIATTSATTVGDERRAHRRTVYDLVERDIVEPIAILHRSPNSR